MTQIEDGDAAILVALAFALVALKARLFQVWGASVGDEHDDWRSGDGGRFGTIAAYVVSVRDAPASAALARLSGRVPPRGHGARVCLGVGHDAARSIGAGAWAFVASEGGLEGAAREGSRGGLLNGVLWSRSLGSRSLGSRSLGSRSLGSWSLGSRSLRRRSLERRSLGRRTLERRTLGRRTLGRRILERWTLGRRTLGRRILERSSLGRRILGRRILERRLRARVREERGEMEDEEVDGKKRKVHIAEE